MSFSARNSSRRNLFFRSAWVNLRCPCIAEPGIDPTCCASATASEEEPFLSMSGVNVVTRSVSDLFFDMRTDPSPYTTVCSKETTLFALTPSCSRTVRSTKIAFNTATHSSSFLFFILSGSESRHCQLEGGSRMVYRITESGSTPLRSQSSVLHHRGSSQCTLSSHLSADSSHT